MAGHSRLMRRVRCIDSGQDVGSRYDEKCRNSQTTVGVQPINLRDCFQTLGTPLSRLGDIPLWIARPTKSGDVDRVDEIKIGDLWIVTVRFVDCMFVLERAGELPDRPSQV